MQKKYVINIDGKELIFEFGKYAKFANESVMVRYGDTAVLVTVTASKDVKEGIDFFPLSVDYTERLYSVGKIPGGFIKREGKPTDNAILVSRCIDRPMRPLFPKDLRNACLIDAMVMSADQDYNPEFVAMIGANMAVHVSDVPFNGPIATVNIGMIDGEYILNPTENERKHSILDLNLAGSKEKIVMIEAGANELTDIEMIEAIKFGHKYIKELCEFQDKVRKEIGKEKFEYTNIKVPENLEKYIIENYGETIDKAIINTNKEDLDNTINEIIKVVKETYTSKIENEENRENLKILNEEYKYISDAVTKIEKEKIRQNVIEKGIRVDGRNTDEVRKLNAEVGNLPRVHGSGLFERGETQVLSVLTLGKVSEEQRLDGVNPEETKDICINIIFQVFLLVKQNHLEVQEEEKLDMVH